ncbi:MAG: hypothetical protein M3Q45_07310, partial [Chloroflexota bacterium]|nr:hypothetical protein [Chloroflexota bacterium]
DGVVYKNFADDFGVDAGSWGSVLPTTQDYLLTLMAGVTTTATPRYRLQVSIITPAAPVPPPTAAPMRVRFAPGTSGATLPGSLAAGAAQPYILGAAAGQTMSVVVASPGNDVVLSIAGLADGVTSWTGVLPSNGDYAITLRAAGGDTNYTLQVTIE